MVNKVCAHLHTYKHTHIHTLLMDEKWKDINRYTDREKQPFLQPPPPHSLTLPPTQKYEDIILLWL